MRDAAQGAGGTGAKGGGRHGVMCWCASGGTAAAGRARRRLDAGLLTLTAIGLQALSAITDPKIRH